MNGLTCKNCFSENCLEAKELYKHSKWTRRGASVLKWWSLIFIGIPFFVAGSFTVIAIFKAISTSHYSDILSNLLMLSTGTTGIWIIVFFICGPAIAVIMMIVAYGHHKVSVYACNLCGHWINRVR